MSRTLLMLSKTPCTLHGAGANVLNKHIVTLLNNTIKHRLREEHVVPLHK